MSQSKIRVADVLFVAQLIGAALFCGAQIHRALTDVAGVSAAQYFLAALFALFNLMLSIGTGTNRESRRVRWTYGLWLALLLATVLAVAANPGYRWDLLDLGMLLAAGVLSLAVLGYARFRQLPIRDPLVLALLAITAKAIPQVLLIGKVLDEGGSGIPLLTILVGHVTIAIRLVQVFLIPSRGAGRHRKWLLVSEGFNELSWIGVTIVWLL